MVLIPGMPFFMIAISGVLTAALGVALQQRRRPVYAERGNEPLLRGGHWMLGQLAGVIAAGAVGIGILVNGATGERRLLLIMLELAAYIGLGIVLPRRPQQQQRREADQLRRLTPGFIGFVRIGLSSMEPPLAILERYCARPQSKQAVLQTLVSEALERSKAERLRPFAALSRVSRTRHCRELSDICDALAQAEAEGDRMETVLEAQQHNLEQILQNEFKRMIRRKTVYLLLMVAISLTVGILLNLLFVMTNGGSLLVEIG